MNEVTTGLPLPPISYRGGRKSKYPFHSMQQGESFFCETIPAIAHWTRRTGKQFSVRSVVEEGRKGFRVWCREA